MVALFITQVANHLALGWSKSPLWFKVIFIIVCIWAVFWIINKIVINAIAAYYARKLVHDELALLMQWRDKIRDYFVVQKHWDCYEQNGIRYYECGLIKMTEMEVFKNILRQHGAGGLSGIVFFIDAVKNSTNNTNQS